MKISNIRFITSEGFHCELDGVKYGVGAKLALLFRQEVYATPINPSEAKEFLSVDPRLVELALRCWCWDNGLAPHEDAPAAIENDQEARQGMKKWIDLIIEDDPTTAEYLWATYPDRL